MRTSLAILVVCLSCLGAHGAAQSLYLLYTPDGINTVWTNMTAVIGFTPATNSGASTIIANLIIGTNGIGSMRSNRIAPATFALSSTLAWTNPITASVEAYVAGGAVQSVSKNGAGNFVCKGITNGCVSVGLQIGEWLVVSNTSTPTVLKWSPFP